MQPAMRIALPPPILAQLEALVSAGYAPSLEAAIVRAIEQAHALSPLAKVQQP